MTEPKEYRDPETGVAFTLQPGWGVTQLQRWGDNETTVFLKDTGSEAVPALYIKPVSNPKTMPAEELRKSMRAASDSKAIQRADAGAVGYRNREGSFVYGKINGRESLSYCADFTVDGKAMVEYFVRAGSEKVQAMFFARRPAAEFEKFRGRLDKLASTLTLP